MSVEHKAADVALDLSKQFMSIAFAGVAFAIGISTANGKASSTWLFWGSIVIFGLSAVLGFLFLMRGAADFSNKKDFDIYETGARCMSFFQIVFVAVGVILLLFLHLQSKSPNKDSEKAMGVKIELEGKTITALPDSSLNIRVSADGSIEIKQGAAVHPEKK